MLQTLTNEAPAKRTQVIRYAKGEALALIEQHGIDRILERYSNGETLAEIAQSIQISAQSLTAYVNRSAYALDYACAKDCHAEAWADRGWKTLQMEGEDVDSATVNRARYKEQHCRWRAGIASSRYSEKQSVELSGPNGSPIAQSVVHVFVPANGRDVVNTIDGETLDK